MLKALPELFSLQALLGAEVAEAEQFQCGLSGVELAITTGWHKADFMEADPGVRSVKVDAAIYLRTRTLGSFPFGCWVQPSSSTI